MTAIIFWVPCETICPTQVVMQIPCLTKLLNHLLRILLPTDIF